MDVAGDVGVGDRKVSAAARLLVAEHNFVARRDRDGVLQLTDANPGALQVTQDRHRPVAFGGQLPHEGNGPGVGLVRAMRKIDARHGEARVHQRADDFTRRRRRTERTDDLGARKGRRRGLRRR